MRERPMELSYFAAIFIAIAISFPMQVMLAYGHSPFEIAAIVTKLAPLNWLVICICLIHAYLLFQASPLALLTAVLFTAATIWNNWVVAAAGLNYSGIFIAIATVGAALIHLPLLRQDMLRLFLNPQLRWWRTPRRVKTEIKTTVRPVVDGEEIGIKAFDVSTGGAFLPVGGTVPGLSHQLFQKPLKVGARCSIRLHLDQLHAIQVRAEVVRHAIARGDYPAGFAIRFIDLDRKQHQILSQFLGKAEKAGMRPALAEATGPTP